ncbi:GAD domain-containing protein [Elusimicrobiota bacterium]
MKNLNAIFEGSDSNIIQLVIGSSGVILGEKLSGKKGYFTQNIEKASEIAQAIEDETGLKGFISSDELPKYGITENDKEKIESEFEVTDDDIVVLVAGGKEAARKAMQILVEKIQ